MSVDDTTPHRREKLRVHAVLSALTLVVGLVLLVYMIRVESEPGALPLLLVALGIGWQVATRVRMRAHQR